IVSTARELATSPCASPPMPSDMTKSCIDSRMRKESSLLLRTRPTSVKPSLAICTAAPSKLSVNTRGTPCADTPASTVWTTLAEAWPPGKPLHPSDYSPIGNTHRRANWKEYPNRSRGDSKIWGKRDWSNPAMAETLLDRKSVHYNHGVRKTSW